VVLLTIQDVNDNSPVFEPSYTASVLENSLDGTVVLLVMPNNKDEGGFNGTLSIIPENSPFHISQSGVITVRNSSALDREKTDQFSLKVKARENEPPYWEAQTTVTILLVDENDNSPVFERTPYEVSLFTNMTVGMLLVEVAAMDLDQDANKSVKLALTGGNEEGYFELNNKGQISLHKKINLPDNLLQNFILILTATDGGVDPRASSVPVRILAFGNSRPYFLRSKYEGTIKEEIALAQIVAQVEFVSFQSIITLEVLTETETFSIDNNGTIWAKTKVDYETHKSYTINGSLTDGKSKDYTTVLVTVLDVNDNIPAFQGVYNDTHVSENKTVGTSVMQMVATDDDEGYNGLLTYTLRGGDGKMEIDSVSGLITLTKELDRETQSSYNLTVNVSDQGQPPHSVELNFPVFVDDINDNYPVFTKTAYEIKVPENEVLENVLAVSATDLDENVNAQVTYRITKQSPSTAAAVFHLDTRTGQLSVVQKLDYETAKVFELEVEAADGGNPRLRSSATLVIHLEDVNDNQPEFSQDVYNIVVLENLQKEAFVYALNVTDKDEGGFSKGHFVLIDGPFNIDKSGVLSLKNGATLDRETTSEFSFQVWAIDDETNGLNSSAVLNITVLDVNDNNPEFEIQTYRFTIPEGNYSPDRPGQVGHIAARDMDEGENGHITFTRSSGEGKDHFSLQQDGTIVAIRPLDRESKNKYELVVVATDNGIPQRQNLTDIVISISDINDNPPRFLQRTYAVNIVVANAKEGDVLTVSATDQDSLNNAVITYSFLNASDAFVINNVTGVISLVSNLTDITADTVITSIVVASDHGIPSLSSTASVILNLLVNATDFGLFFESTSYDFSIPEHESKKTVGTVKALTGSMFVTVTYSLKSYTDRFTINNQGDIVTLVELGREEQSAYTVIVEAIDSRTPATTAVTLVTINIDDINDNPPVFSPLVQTKVSVLEGQVTIDFGSFTAIDRDAGENGIITYSLDNDFDRIFAISSSTGRLISTRALDRETVDMYELTIIVSFIERMVSSASVAVNITVEDVNDNPPVFIKETYNITVKENEPPHEIFYVAATDKDVNYNAIIHYKIIEGDSLFYIGEISGNIGTLQLLDYETSTEHLIKVMAFNPGNLGAEDAVLMVEDVNEEGPKFLHPSYHTVLFDNATAGSLVVDIDAVDENVGYDEGINYSITDGNTEGLFRIVNKTGQITLTKDLIRTDITLEYSVRVTATDQGSPTLSNSVKVTIIVAPSDSAVPVFSAAVYQPAPLSEKTSTGTLVIQTSALYHLPLLYSLVAGNEKDYFSSDASSGVIKTKKSINVEDFPVLIHVPATDSTNSSIFNEASVNISAIDENDFSPAFPSSLVHTKINEEAATPVRIVQLSATDKETGRNGDITYGLVNGAERRFRINPSDGVLYADVSFDYENGTTEYQIVVCAEDNGIPEKKRGYCTVVISITDVNDWPPVFEPVNPIVVEENTSIGTVVGKVTATDRDTGDNGLILYSIIGEGDMFEINGSNGAIQVKSPPDYEQQNEYHLIVHASNKQSTTFILTATDVHVTVLDVNDNAPEFTHTNYTANVTMSSPIGTHVITVTATDKDKGNNGLVEYYIQFDWTYSQYFLFENPYDGRIITAGDLPNPGFISLTVIAKDRGNPSLNSTVQVTIEVLDDRPFVPAFNQSAFRTTIMENMGAGYLVYTFKVMETLRKHIIYTIVAGNERGHFRLEGNTGHMFTTVNLNYEDISQYSIVVEATG
uniref:Cadherin domain-containing protein n=1 Tax=Latimeria chalumnae TaxID=7897 RepID=H3A003_LATCH